LYFCGVEIIYKNIECFDGAQPYVLVKVSKKEMFQCCAMAKTLRAG